MLTPTPEGNAVKDFMRPSSTPEGFYAPLFDPGGVTAISLGSRFATPGKQAQYHPDPGGVADYSQ